MSEEFNTEVASIMVRQALEDLEATENKEYFEIDMNNWVYHEDRYEDEVEDNYFGPVKLEFNRICKVCFAGSVMSNRFKVLKNDATPYDLDHRTTNCLLSLDKLRRYRYDLFLVRCYPTKTEEEIGLIVDELNLLDLTKVFYEENAQQFKENMNKIADKLEELGL